MLKTKCEYSRNIIGAKHISIVLLIICVFSCLSPVVTYAATKEGLTYSGESYYAINTYGVNMRDAKGNLITYISSNHCMKVLGVYSADKSRAVIEYNGKIGHVLKGGLKNVKTKYSFTATSGGEYTATNNCAVNFRDENYKKIQTIPKGKEMTVLGIWSSKTYSGRAVVVYNGLVGTVLNSELTKKTTVSGDSKNEIEDETSNVATANGYWAWTGAGLNMRKEIKSGQTLGEFIEYIPGNSLVWVEGVNKNDTSRANITFNGSKGTVLKSGLKKLTTSEFIPFTKNSLSYAYAVTNAGLNMRKNVDSNSNGEKDLIKLLERCTLVYVLGVSKEETNRVVVVWNGKIGTVLLTSISSLRNSTAVSVSIDRQKTTLFENGKIKMQSDCVTGTLDESDTTKGKHNVIYMAKNHYMSRPQKWVDYWIGFYGHEGFHDAKWRNGVFGGKIYKTNGSNGCVNLPTDAAQTIYKTLRDDYDNKKTIYVYISGT